MRRQDWLVRLGLKFADPADEAEFSERFLSGWIVACQALLVGGALFYYSFFVWDALIDPVHAGTTHVIRGLIVAPVLVISAVILLSRWGRRHAEVIMLVNMITGHVGLVCIYSILAGGYRYAAVAALLMYIGTLSACPIRTSRLAFASLFVFVSFIVGHVYADNAPPGWLVVNILLMACGVTFGSISAYVRERAARIQFRTDKELAASRARIDDLLYSILPRDVIQRIQAGETAIAESLGEVSIIFADLAGFTELARRVSANDLVKVLARLFSSFDREAERYGIDRIKTIGDAYMAIGGLSRSVGRDHVEDAADFALAVQGQVRRIVAETGYPIDVRIGLHVGPVIAGVIGRRRPAFDCWGESVNLASRLESNAPRGGILISESAYWRLRERFELAEVEDVLLKGIGLTKVFELKQRKVERTGLRLVSTEDAA